MTIENEQQKFLMEFDDPQEVEIVCRIIYGQLAVWHIPKLMIDAQDKGWIKPADGLGPLSSIYPSRGIYPRIVMLTDKGREQLGLPLVTPEQPKKKPKSLFD